MNTGHFGFCLLQSHCVIFCKAWWGIITLKLKLSIQTSYRNIDLELEPRTSACFSPPVSNLAFLLKFVWYKMKINIMFTSFIWKDLQITFTLIMTTSYFLITVNILKCSPHGENRCKNLHTWPLEECRYVQYNSC